MLLNWRESTDVAITLSTRSNGAMGSGTILKLERNNNMYRVRKLTPRECGRLMGVEDKDIDNILKTVSNSQAYKQFGNSIVVDVLAEMFKNIFTDVPTPVTNKDADDLDTLSIYELLEKLGGSD